MYVKLLGQSVFQFDDEEVANLVVDAGNRTVTNPGDGDSVGRFKEDILRNKLMCYYISSPL